MFEAVLAPLLVIGTPLAVFVFPFIWFVVAARARSRGRINLARASLICLSLTPVAVLFFFKAPLGGAWWLYFSYIPINLALLALILLASSNVRTT